MRTCYKCGEEGHIQRDCPYTEMCHATTKRGAKGIEANGFRCGTSGKLGGGAYFTEDEEEARRKARIPKGAKRVVIKALVNLGNSVDSANFHVDEDAPARQTRRDLKRYGADSVHGEGTTHAVYDTSRIGKVRRHHD